MNFLKGMILTAFVGFVGCATVQTADPRLDAEAKKFVPPSGSSNLYVARKYESFGSLIAFKVFLDGNEIGSMAPGMYQLAVVRPGAHKIEVKTDLSSAKFEVDCEAGKNYFYQAEAKSGGPFLRVELDPVPIEAMGKLMIGQSTRAQGKE